MSFAYPEPRLAVRPRRVASLALLVALGTGACAADTTGGETASPGSASSDLAYDVRECSLDPRDNLEGGGVTPVDPDEHGIEVFTDLGSHWAASPINALLAEGIVAGYDVDRDGRPDQFRPYQALTRAEWAALLYNAMGLDEVAAGAEPTRAQKTVFRADAASIIQAASCGERASAKLIDTYSPVADQTTCRAEQRHCMSRVCGDAPCTEAGRQQCLLEARQCFVDWYGDWYTTQVCALTYLDVFKGDERGFRPQDTLSKAEVWASVAALFASERYTAEEAKSLARYFDYRGSRFGNQLYKPGTTELDWFAAPMYSLLKDDMLVVDHDSMGERCAPRLRGIDSSATRGFAAAQLFMGLAKFDLISKEAAQTMCFHTTNDPLSSLASHTRVDGAEECFVEVGER